MLERGTRARRRRGPAAGRRKGSCWARPATCPSAADELVAVTPDRAPCSSASPPRTSRSSTSTATSVDGRARPDLRARPAPRRLPALRRRGRGPHPRADGHRAGVRARRAPGRALPDARARRTGPGRAVRDVRNAGAGRADARRARGRSAALMANHGTITFGADLDGAVENVAAARVGLHGLLARGGARAPRACSTRQQQAAVVDAVGRPAATACACRARDAMKAITLGVHVVDVLVRPVERSPTGQGGQLVDEIRITAGRAGRRHRGHAGQARRRGASAGAIGTDALGDVLIDLLDRFGVDTSLLVRRDGVQTSASVLPIRPDGSRPAFHVVGANATYSLGRRALGRDRRRHPPAPRRARVHGRRGGGQDPRLRPRARRRHLGRHPRSGRAGRGDPRLDRARASSTSTTCCPTTSRCSG